MWMKGKREMRGKEKKERREREKVTSYFFCKK